MTGPRAVAVKLGKAGGKKSPCVQRAEDVERILSDPVSLILALMIGCYLPVLTHPSPLSRRERQP